MLPIDEIRAEKVLNLARERFSPNLAEVEERIIRQSCDSVELKDLPDDLPERPDAGWDGPVIRPAFLQWLATDPDVAQHVYQSWITIDQVRFAEDPDLFNFVMQSSLFFRFCLFEGVVSMTAAKLEHLMLRRCTLLSDMRANHIHMRGSLFFLQVQVRGLMNLESSRVDGRVELSETEFTHAEFALSLQNGVFGGNLDLTTNFRSAGVVSLWGARVTGYLRLNGAKLSGQPISLGMDGARIQGIVTMTGGFEATGQILGRAVEIGQWLDMDRASLTAAGTAMSLEGAQIGGHALFRGGFSCSGGIHMAAARFGGSLNFSGAKLSGPVTLDNSTITSNLIFSEGFESSGEISMNCGEIRGSIHFSGAHLTGPKADLRINNVTVAGNAFFRAGFTSAAVINLSLSEFKGQLEFSGAHLISTEPCLLLHHVHVAGSVFLDEGFKCLGTVRVRTTRIDGQLACEDASMSSLVCQQSGLGQLFWKRCQNPESVQLDLTGSHIALLRDEVSSWPKKGNLVITGLIVEEYESLSPSRLDWLDLQKETATSDAQPWIHAAKHLRDKGYAGAAKYAIYKLRRHQAMAYSGGRASRLFLVGWKLAIAKVEEKPLRILLSVLVCVLLGTSLFWPYRAHFAETSDAAYKSTHEASPLHPEQPGAYPRFQPALYALENTLPIVHLAQDDHWAPDRRITTPRLYWTLSGTRWFLILAGWGQGIVLAAALDSRFRS